MGASGMLVIVNASKQVLTGASDVTRVAAPNSFNSIKSSDGVKRIHYNMFEWLTVVQFRV